MLTTKFLISAAATIATAGAIGVAVAQTTYGQTQGSSDTAAPSGSTSAATPAAPAPADSSSSAATTTPSESSTTGAVGSSVSDESMAKTDRN